MDRYTRISVWGGSEESDPLSKEKEGVQQHESAHRVNYAEKEGVQQTECRTG
jgi:hypothetical protein